MRKSKKLAKGSKVRSAGVIEVRLPLVFTEELSSMLDRGTAKSAFDDLGKVSVAARLPVALVARLDAVAERLNENRTEALCRLVDEGWKVLVAAVKPDTQKALLEIYRRKEDELVDEFNRRSRQGSA